MQESRLAIVVPCYNEAPVLEETTRRLAQVLSSLVTKGLISENSFVMYVNDGSSDLTWAKITAIHARDQRFCGTNLAGNVGHQKALMAGLTVAKERADLLISIDADLQDDVLVMADMVQKFHDGFDIVYGVRRERSTDTFFKRNTALLFYRFMSLLGTHSVYNHADYRLMSKRAVNFLCTFPERNLFLRGLVPTIGYATTTVYYDRSKRLAGESKYPFRKMVNFALDGITSFSVKPVRMVFTVGLVFLLVALGILIWIVYEYSKGNTIQGWSSLMLSVWFVGGIILVSLGIVGEYIGKIYIEVKHRPLYNLEEVLW